MLRPWLTFYSSASEVEVVVVDMDAQPPRTRGGELEGGRKKREKADTRQGRGDGEEMRFPKGIFLDQIDPDTEDHRYANQHHKNYEAEKKAAVREGGKRTGREPPSKGIKLYLVPRGPRPGC